MFKAAAGRDTVGVTIDVVVVIDDVGIVIKVRIIVECIILSIWSYRICAWGDIRVECVDVVVVVGIVIEVIVVVWVDRVCGSIELGRILIFNG